MFCTEITDALWKRYLSQHPENLIDEDSSLLTFARAQSIRRKRHDSSGSQEGQNHQRLGRILSHRSTGGSFRLNRTGSTNRSFTDSKTDDVSCSQYDKTSCHALTLVPSSLIS
ncbi:hypothetical protein COOONC_22556 [Cooperia oncophora]